MASGQLPAQSWSSPAGPHREERFGKRSGFRIRTLHQALSFEPLILFPKKKKKVVE